VEECQLEEKIIEAHMPNAELLKLISTLQLRPLCSSKNTEAK
jgi:hypothetical protein